MLFLLAVKYIYFFYSFVPQIYVFEKHFHVVSDVNYQLSGIHFLLLRGFTSPIKLLKILIL